MKRRILICFTFLFLFNFVSYPQTINGVKVKIIDVNSEMNYIKLSITNNSGKKIKLHKDEDIILAIDQNARQAFGFFTPTKYMKREMGLKTNYNYSCVLNNGKQREIYIFFDRRVQVELNNIRSLVYHFYGMKFRLA